jgi:hypothetical protein
MAGPRFLEILKCNGVDQDAVPYPGMIVPFLGENQILLETSGFDVEVQSRAIKLQEFDGCELTSELLRGVQEALSGADVDPQQRDAFMPYTAWNKPRFFRILGTIKTGLPGTVVRVVSRSKRGAGPAITLQVAIVDRLVVKVAIRNVRARDAQGRMRFHAKRRCNPAKEVAQMNAIWTPQTNIAFELVPSIDLDVDHNDPKTQADLRKAYGLNGPATFSPD